MPDPHSESYLAMALSRTALILLAMTTVAMTPGWSADVTITVHPDRVLREDASHWIGINLNYIRDHDVNRPPGSQPLSASLDAMGVRWLRFPGGEKSDYHRFA